MIVVIGIMVLILEATNSVQKDGNGGIVMLLIYIPTMWFSFAQGAKRCHDRGNSGWWQIIPFYWMWMLFVDGEIGDNDYGPNPKGLYYDHGDCEDGDNETTPIDDVDEDGVIKS